MLNQWKKILFAILVISCCSVLAFRGIVQALEKIEVPQVPPSKALISGVPYISWNEASQLDYQDKDILNPSFPASLGMILKYWGQDLKLLKQSKDAPPNDGEGWGIFKHGEAKSFEEVKSFIARGIPILISPAITPIAHTPSPTIVTLATMKDFKFKEKGPSSGVLGKMMSLDDLEQLKKFLSKELKMDPKYVWESLLASARVVIGYDDARKVVIMHDPSFGPAMEVNYEDFDKMWSARNRDYIIAYPADYAKILSQRLTASPYRVRTPDEQAAEYFVYGYALASAGRVQEAEERFNKGLIIPGIGKGYQHLFYSELALIYFYRGKYEEALFTIQQAIELLPQHHRPYQLLTVIYRAKPIVTPLWVQPLLGNAGAQIYTAKSIAEMKQNAKEANDKSKALCADNEAQKNVGKFLGRDFFIFGCTDLTLLGGSFQ